MLRDKKEEALENEQIILGGEKVRMAVEPSYTE